MGKNIDFNEGYLRQITETSERARSNSHRLDEVEEDIKSLKDDNRALYEMSASMKALATNVSGIKDDVKEIRTEQGEMKNEIQDLRLAPTKTKANWFDSVGKFIITAVGAGILSFLLGNICPNIFR